MGRIVVTEFISLDGVVESPAGSEGFDRGGWTGDTDQGEDGAAFKLDEALRADALLLGRITYEEFAAVWPTVHDEFGDKINAMPKYVVSSTLIEPGWNNTTLLRGDDVVEWRLMVFPVILGKGRRLFADTRAKEPVRLADSRTVGAGIAVLTYQAAA
jgi:dihydrofolate reductase